jgi:hypothetical protein
MKVIYKNGSIDDEKIPFFGGWTKRKQEKGVLNDATI